MSIDTLSPTPKKRRPSFIWFSTEAGRALFELSTFYPYKFIGRHKDTGDGHPVMVLPGFMASDISTRPLCRYLDDIGYSSYGWNVGRNYAKTEYIPQLLNRIERLYNRYGTKISLIGWSLGGVYARQLAKESPNMIRQVIAMGSPFAGLTEQNNARWMHNIITRGKGTQNVDPELLADVPIAPPVPFTSIYSKEDGIVSWETCTQAEENEFIQNIRIRGSHLGLGVNPSALHIISNRLLYNQTNWVPFQSSNNFTDRFFFPTI